MLTLACRLEKQSIQYYNKWAMECASKSDSVSKKLFEDLLGDEGRHYAQYDTELENLEKFGEHYLVLQSIERSKQTASGTAQT